jgi:ribonuclease VapC
MVVDSSVLLALLFAEPGAEWAVEKLMVHAHDLRMSTVNLAEVLIRLQDRQPHLYKELRSEVLESSIRFIPPDPQQAQIAAEARHRFPLNLGDCFAYALASVEGCPVLAMDDDFRSIDLPVVLP